MTKTHLVRACTLRFGQLAIVHAEAWAGGRGAPLPMSSQRWPRMLHELAESEEIVEAGLLDPVVYIYCHFQPSAERPVFSSHVILEANFSHGKGRCPRACHPI